MQAIISAIHHAMIFGLSLVAAALSLWLALLAIYGARLASAVRHQ